MNWKSMTQLMTFLLLFGALLASLSFFFDLDQLFGLRLKLIRFFITVFSTYVILFLAQRSLRVFFQYTHLLDPRREETIESILKTGSNLIAIIIVIAAAISPFVDLVKVLAGEGIIRAIVGFGAQSLIKDFLYGCFLSMNDSFIKGICDYK
jgi:small-conductance mechanosensitive channel